MKHINSFWKYIKSRPLLSAGIAVLVIIVFLVSRGNGGDNQYFVVKEGSLLEQVSVSGKVVAASAVDLGFDQSGRVAWINGKVGDSVRAGTTLASIENGDLRAEVLRKEAALETAKANLRSLEIGTRPEEIAVTQSTVDSARVSLKDAKQVVLDSIKNSYSVSDDAVRSKADLFFSNPRSSNPQLTFTTSDSVLSNRVVAERLKLETVMFAWQTRIAGLTADSTDLMSIAEESQQNLSLVNTFLNDCNTALALANSNPTISQTNLDTFKTTISTARTNVNTAASTLTGAISSESSYEAALVSAQRSLALDIAGTAQSDLEAQRATVKAAEADLLSSRARLAKTLIVAPYDGIITKMDLRVGKIVSPNTPEVAMMSREAFEIESYVPEVSISLINVADEADVVLDAYGEAQKFPAKIVSIAPAETVRDGVSTYKVTLQFITQDARIRSGMTANVSIKTMEKQNAISIPMGVILKRPAGSFVYVKRNGDAVEQKIETGITTMLGQVEVVSGLNNGDQVLLNPPKK